MYPNLLYVGRNFSQKFEEQGWWDCQCVWSCCWWREQDLHYYSSCFNPGCCCCSCLYNSSNQVGKQDSDQILFISFLLLRYCLIFTGFSNQALYQLLSTGQVQYHVMKIHIMDKILIGWSYHLHPWPTLRNSNTVTKSSSYSSSSDCSSW